ncbi:MAG: YIP1 family protein, partial [Pseudomonadota bacterium]
TQAIISSVAVAIGIPAIMALYAGYLLLVNKMSARQFSFKHWFSLTAWTGIPSVLAALVSLIVLLTDSNGQVSQQELQPLSVTGLLNIDTSSQSLQQLSVFSIWALVLVAFGYSNWTGKSIATSFAITWAPYLLIYGGIALASL